MNRHGILLTGLLLLLPYVAGTIWPDVWWGTHHAAFLPPFWGLAVALASAGLGWWCWRTLDAPLRLRSPGRWPGLALIVLVGAASGLLFYAFPIADDHYGNARNFQPFLDSRVTVLPADFAQQFFSWQRGRGALRIVTLVAYLTEVPYGEAFRRMDAVCGAASVMVWLWGVRFFLRDSPWQWVVAVAGLPAPFLQLYFGHAETYAPVALFLLLWLVLLAVQLRTRSAWLAWLLVPLWIVGLRLHVLMGLLAPALLLALLRQLSSAPAVARLLGVRGVLLGVFAPLCVGGLLVYVFVLGDHADPRRLDRFQDVERLFLPVLSPPPPLDRYNLLGWNHLFDCLNAVFLWSPAALFLGAAIALHPAGRPDGRRPELGLLLLTLLCFLAMLFMANPLFSMPMDWDLYSLPAPILLVLLLMLAEPVRGQPAPRGLLAGGLALALLAIPSFAVNASARWQSQRLESVGIHVFKTYYEHSASYLLHALQLGEPGGPDPARSEALLRKLEPHALPGNDAKYAALHSAHGRSLLGRGADGERALHHLREAVRYAPDSPVHQERLREARRRLGDERS